MFGKLLYQYLGCSQDFATVLFFVQGLCERECTVPFRGSGDLALAGGWVGPIIRVMDEVDTGSR